MNYKNFCLNKYLNLSKPNHNELINLHSCIEEENIRFNYKNPEQVNHTFKLKEIKFPFDKKIKPKVILKSALSEDEIINNEIRFKFEKALEFLNIKDENKYIQKEDAELLCKLFLLNLVNELTLDKDLEDKPPLISIMGHVDHGKTTLLDSYRKSTIAENEAGGITQKIGGFNVETNFGKISFIDTPGHAIFSNMRHRGAIITDIIILVISAVEGVQKQTLEVINLIKNYNIPVVIAINKIDSPKADPENVEEQLINLGLDLEDYGGNIPCIHISAKKNINTDLLLELALYESHKLKIKGNKKLNPEIFCLESSNSNLKETKSTSVIIKNGTLNYGDYVIIKNKLNKCIIIKNDRGYQIKKGECGEIIELYGINELPNAGEFLTVFKEEKLAKKYIKMVNFINNKLKDEELLNLNNIGKVKLKYTNRKEKRSLYSGDKSKMLQKLISRIKELEEESKDENLTNDNINKIKTELNECYKLKYFYQKEKSKLGIIIKTRDYGILETINHQIESKNLEYLDIIKIEVGPINDNDIFLAKETNSKIYSMDVEISELIKKEARNNKVDIQYHNIIYKFFEEIELNHEEFEIEEKKNMVVGKAIIEKIFVLKGSKKKIIAGCKIESGKIIVDGIFKLLRKNKIVKDKLKASSLKHFKKEVNEVEEGQEIGLSLINCNYLEEGDIIECYNP